MKHTVRVIAGTLVGNLSHLIFGWKIPVEWRLLSDIKVYNLFLSGVCQREPAQDSLNSTPENRIKY